MPADRSAVILAGGRSSRMGSPKAWLDWGGRPLLVHVLEVVGEVCRGPIVVVGAPGQDLPELPGSVVRVDDPPRAAGGGPLVGLAVGLLALAARTPEAAIAYLGACDNVELDVAHVRFMTGLVAGDAALEAAIPRDPPAEGGKRFAHPLASAVRIGPAARAARALVDAGTRRPIALFDRLATRFVDVDELPHPASLATCNTPKEYAAARGRAGAG